MWENISLAILNIKKAALVILMQLYKSFNNVRKNKFIRKCNFPETYLRTIF